MWKKSLSAIFLAAAVMLCGCSRAAAPAKPIYCSKFIRAAWVAAVWGIDFPREPTTNSTALKAQIDSIVEKAAVMDLNTLFFQVRPSADAFYKSNLFPWSRFLTGTQGLAPADNFDPLEYMIDCCHKVGIRLHAWINPYRITTLATDSLAESHPAATAPWLVIEAGGKLYFNPGEAAARELIIDGVREIVENYAVDGIHFDDYFYPEGMMNQDEPSFDARLNKSLNLADWRRDNVNRLVRDTWAAVKQINPDVAFGVSPSGIWANKSGANTLGSNTLGFESLNAIYADSRAWVKNGWVDYIAPQIYWSIGQKNSDFAVVLDWWRDVCRGTTVALYAGLAGYKNFTAQEYADQITLAREKADGFIVFSMKDCMSALS